MASGELFAWVGRGEVRSVAGVGYRDGVPAREAPSGWTLGVVRVPTGDLIVCDYWGHRIWRIDAEGILHLHGGDGVAGNSGDGGPVAEARFREPHDLTVDRHGNLYLSDLGNQVYRRIDAATGEVTRVVGSGAVGRGGDGGPATEAELDTTCGIAVDEAGNLYLASEWASTIRRVDATTGIIERFAGLDARHYPSEVASGTVASGSRPTAGPWLSLVGYHGDGGSALEAAFWHPEHLAFDSAGDLYVCDNSNDRIRKIDMRSGVVTTVLGNGQRASNGDGGPAVEASTLMPDAICLDPDDNLYVGEKYGFRVRKVTRATGVVDTLVGTGVPGWGDEEVPGRETACNSVEAGIWADPDQTVFWGDCSGRLRRYDGSTGLVTTVLGGTSIHDGESADQAFLRGPTGMAKLLDGSLVFADSWNQRVRQIDATSGAISTIAGNGARAYGGDGGPAADAYLGNPYDVSVDLQGRVVIADHRHHRIRRVEADGTIVSICGTGQPWDQGDGGAAACAALVSVRCLTHSPDGDLYFGDGIGRIRRIDAASGIVTTVAGIGLPGYLGDGGPAVAARIGDPAALAFAADGSLYFTDQRFAVIRRIDPKGVIHTVVGTGVSSDAGGPRDGDARRVELHDLRGLAVAGDGTCYYAERSWHCVRRISPNGVVETIAGSPSGAGGDSDGSAVGERPALLNEPWGLLLYRPDLLLISDHANNRIKALRL